MKTFHLTSTTLSGHVEFQFNDNGLLDKMEIHADLSEKQQIFLLRNMPAEIAGLDRLKSPTVTITEFRQDITFDMFWQKYDDRINSSKKRTKQKWDKMTAADQARAYWFVPKYIGSIPAGTRKKFAETYLNAELWNN